jgi:hypothetical protein
MEEQALEFASDRALFTGLGEIEDVHALHIIPTDCTLYAPTLSDSEARRLCLYSVCFVHIFSSGHILRVLALQPKFCARSNSSLSCSCTSAFWVKLFCGADTFTVSPCYTVPRSKIALVISIFLH